MEFALYLVEFFCPAGVSAAGMVKISKRWNEYLSSLLVTIDHETAKKHSILSICLNFRLAFHWLPSDSRGTGGLGRDIFCPSKFG